MSWASLALAILQAAASFMAWAKERQALKTGEDAALARAAVELLELTEAGKALREKIRTLSDTEAEELWKRMLQR